MYIRKDSFYKKAKQEGYRSRAAYKLKELVDKYSLFSGVRSLLDVGAAPGGWSQVALELLSKDSTVVGVDILNIQPIPNQNYHFIMGDIREDDTLKRILEIKSKFDAVISDIAPNTTGQKFVDHQNSMNLIKIVVDFTKKVLKKDGVLIFKLFDGEDREKLVSDLKLIFKDLKIFRPDATRKNSFEIYVICRGFLGE
ncbi:MAG: RlmE family RNA methyltransferase [Calditerrivibrio sp.]|nr:RlmE family RNA methyltransferase [Calditerrivibrio sp.]MCA1979963.1 RlmE family RNA methyltransferase [Calditerrivibrio sp.]